MRRLIVIVTGLHVLAHSIFGCCDHAVATCSGSVETDDCGHAVAKHDQAGRHVHDHREAAHDDEPQASCTTNVTCEHSVPHEPHNCNHDSCHWLTSDALAVNDFLDFHYDVAFVPMTDAAIASAPAVDFWTVIDVGRHHARALRLHLELSVLLI